MNNRRLSITMIASIIAFAVNSGIGFLLTPYIVKQVGSEAYGFVSLANSFTNYIQILTIAINSMAGRFITISLVQKKYDDANKYFTSAFYANAFMATVLLCFSLLFVWKLEYFINITSTILVDVKTLFLFVFLSFVVTLFGSTFATSTFAANRKDLEAKVNIESHVIKGTAIILLFSFLKPHVFFVGLASFLMVLYTLVANIRYTKKLIPDIKIKKSNYDFKKIITLIKAGIWNSFGHLSSVLSNGLDLLIANLFIGSETMGVLSIAKILPSVIGPFVGTVNAIFTPSYTISYAKSDKAGLKKDMLKASAILSAITNICICVLFVLGKPFFRLWVPTMNDSVLHILACITIAYLCIEGVIQCVWNIFIITNKLKLNCIVSVCISFLNVLIVFILLKTTNLGVYAIASVSVTTSILKTLLFSIPHAAKCIEIEKRFFYIPVIKSVFSLTISIIICSVICSFKPVNGWIDLFLMAIPVVVISGIITICIMLKPSEIKSILRKFKSLELRKYTFREEIKKGLGSLEKEIDIILSLLRYEFLGEDISLDIKNLITSDTLLEVYKLSKKHDITPVIADVLYKNNFLSLDTDVCRLFQDEQIKAVFRCENQTYEFGRIKKLFEENKIPFIPLKGSVIREYYPETFMRTSCDIDILIKEEDIKKASSLLSETLKYKTDNNRSTHDVTFFSDSGVCLELHFDLNEANFKIFEPLSHAFDYAHKKENGFEFVLEREFFVFYHLVHMAKHFAIGGCGIKPFIDLMILKKANFYDEKKLLKLCNAYKLKKFYLSVLNVIYVWFYGKEYTDTVRKLEHYIITGGVYGSFSNRVFVKQSKSGSSIAFLFRRVFLTLPELRRNLNKPNINVFQYPYYTVKRILNLRNQDKRKNISNEIKTSSNIPKDSLKSMKKLLDDIGL